MRIRASFSLASVMKTRPKKFRRSQRKLEFNIQSPSTSTTQPHIATNATARLISISSIAKAFSAGPTSKPKTSKKASNSCSKKSDPSAGVRTRSKPVTTLPSTVHQTPLNSPLRFSPHAAHAAALSVQKRMLRSNNSRPIPPTRQKAHKQTHSPVDACAPGSLRPHETSAAPLPRRSTHFCATSTTRLPDKVPVAIFYPSPTLRIETSFQLKPLRFNCKTDSPRLSFKPE